MFFKMLMQNLQMVYRMLRSLVVLPIIMAKQKIYTYLNLNKYISLIPKFLAEKLGKVRIKPEKREDYIDAGPVYIAKSLLLIMLVLLVAIPLLTFYFVWPWIIGMFLTANLVAGEPKLENYSGKVRIYYEQKKENVLFEGRMKEGKFVNAGKEFYVNGQPKYAGSYSDSKFDGEGIYYAEDGSQIYRGSYKAGKYEGVGEQLVAEGMIYQGEFVGGARSGKGQIFEKGTLAYTGTFAENKQEGPGTALYRNGKEKYAGNFQGGFYSGKGLLNNEKGEKIYEGDFAKGLFQGEGRYYDEKGNLVYSGSFVNGLYDGKGKLVYVPNSMWLEGSFVAGKASGDGKLYRDGLLFYEGGFKNDMLSGNGKLTDIASGLFYTGPFENNNIAYGMLFNMKVADIYAAFPKGLEEDLSNPNYFLLYNQKYGMLMKLNYANATQEAKMVSAFCLPQTEMKVNQGEELKLLGTFGKGKDGTGVIDREAARFLGTKQSNLKFVQAIYKDYELCCWFDPETEKVELLEYTALTKVQEKGKLGKADSSKTKAGSQEMKRVAFEELGLSQADFTSLGY